MGNELTLLALPLCTGYATNQLTCAQVNPPMASRGRRAGTDPAILKL